jgi:hypothetical protein
MAECVVVKFSSDSVRVGTVEFSNIVSDEGHVQLSGSVFGLYHIICLLLSITTFTLDVGFDSWLAYFYYSQGQGAYFALTATFLIFPALITTAFSLRWYVVNFACCLTSRMYAIELMLNILILCILLCICILKVLYRHTATF